MSQLEPSFMPPQVPDGCMTRESYMKLKEETHGMYAGMWARVTKVLRDVGEGKLVERHVYTEYGSFEEVGVLGDYSMAAEKGAFKLTSDVTCDDRPIGGDPFPGFYELSQELRRCSVEELKNMALAMEDEDDALQEKQEKKRPHPEMADKIEEHRPRVLRRWRRGVLRPREGDAEMAHYEDMETVETVEHPIEEEDSQRTLMLEQAP